MDDSMLCFPPPVARAFLRGDETHPQLTGEVLLAPYGRGTLLLARVVGLFPAGVFFKRGIWRRETIGGVFFFLIF